LEKDHTVTITFCDTALKPVAASTQSVAIIADAKSSKQTVEFEKKGEVWKTPSAGSAMSTISGSSDFCSNHLPTRAQIRNNS